MYNTRYIPPNSDIGFTDKVASPGGLLSNFAKTSPLRNTVLGIAKQIKKIDAANTDTTPKSNKPAEQTTFKILSVNNGPIQTESNTKIKNLDVGPSGSQIDNKDKITEINHSLRLNDITAKVPATVSGDDKKNSK